ncbi:MAG: ferrous iron transporter B [Oligoflexia bacterium]|nr:ferrous iron transporter B [Oligoflexia bacterium]
MIEIVLSGRPNSGKSTLFNQLATKNVKVGNYAGCTVEKVTATVYEDGVPAFEISDLPGIYSLEPNTLDEKLAIEHLGSVKGNPIVFVLDGNNLKQELLIPLQLKKQGHQIIIAVNMIDEVRANKKILDLASMTELSGIPFFPISAKTGEGLGSLKKFLAKTSVQKAPHKEDSVDLQTIKSEVKKLTKFVQGDEDRLLARDRKIDSILLHRFFGAPIFLLVIFALFQSVFSWSAPFSDAIESGLGLLGDWISTMGDGLLISFLVDGIIGGLGAVLVFVPQIAMLFFLLGLLEYSGYLPRVAAMVDRFFRPYGLNGKVFIPLLSSVACAVPGIMSTRTIENERTRLIAILISPLMTCSARLPVYTLLIATFVPSKEGGWLSTAGFVMFGMYLVGIIAALAVALILNFFDLGRPRAKLEFIHFPHYRSPNWKELFRYVLSRVNLFLKKAGTIIAAMAIILWALLTFPKMDETILESQKAAIETSESSQEEKEAKLEDLQMHWDGMQLERSYGGRIGKFIAPVFAPIGYDWKLSIGIVASLAAREVFVSTIGTVFSLGEVDESSGGLMKALQEEKAPDGSLAYSIATCVSLLLFFAFSLQCISTIGIAKRETNSWKIPGIMFIYMFALAYGAAFIGYQLTRVLIG